AAGERGVVADLAVVTGEELGEERDRLLAETHEEGKERPVLRRARRTDAGVAVDPQLSWEAPAQRDHRLLEAMDRLVVRRRRRGAAALDVAKDLIDRPPQRHAVRCGRRAVVAERQRRQRRRGRRGPAPLAALGRDAALL